MVKPRCPPFAAVKNNILFILSGRAGEFLKIESIISIKGISQKKGFGLSAEPPVFYAE